MAGAPSEHTEQPAPQYRVGPIITVLVLSAMIMIMNETTLSVALPSIMADFGVGADVVQWLVTGFLLTMAVVIPTTGWLLQRFTTRALFITSLTLFVVGSVMGALAPAFWVLLLARVVQACGTAMLLPMLMTVTLTIVAPERRGVMMGLNSVVISVAPAVGPTLAGFIINSQTWHHLFWVMVPIGIIVLIAGIFFLKNVGVTRKVPLDVFSVILSIITFGALVYGLSTVGQLIQGGSSWPIVALLIGFVGVAFFAYRQRHLGRTGRALLDLTPFTVRNFVISAVVVVMAMAMMLGTVNVLPIYLQSSLGVTALATGLIVLPGGLIQGIISPFIGRLYDSVGARPIAIPGALLMLIAQWWLHFIISPDTSVTVLICAHVLFNVGMALVMTPLMTISLASLPGHLYAHGSAAMNTLQQLGGAAGTAVLIAAMTIGTTHAMQGGAAAEAATAHGTGQAFVAGGILAIIAVVASFFIGKPPKATRVVEETA